MGSPVKRTATTSTTTTCRDDDVRVPGGGGYGYSSSSSRTSRTTIQRPLRPQRQRRRQQRKHSQLFGLLDDLRLIFSEEGKKNRKAYEERERREQEAAQREILERRRNPNKMEEYEREYQTKREKLQKERDVWKFQTEQKSTNDPISEWNRLKKEGKIKSGSQLERDPTTSRLGSEGLVDVRTDELLPYIDQGYVDEDADTMGNFMKLFGGGKKNKKQ